MTPRYHLIYTVDVSPLRNAKGKPVERWNIFASAKLSNIDCNIMTINTFKNVG